jgi:hypothetical protein
MHLQISIMQKALKPRASVVECGGAPPLLRAYGIDLAKR